LKPLIHDEVDVHDYVAEVDDHLGQCLSAKCFEITGRNSQQSLVVLGRELKDALTLLCPFGLGVCRIIPDYFAVAAGFFFDVNDGDGVPEVERLVDLLSQTMKVKRR
jgi:hypothetical protein